MEHKFISTVFNLQSRANSVLILFFSLDLRISRTNIDIRLCGIVWIGFTQIKYGVMDILTLRTNVYVDMLRDSG